MTLSLLDATRMQECLADGGVVVFPADTVYGIGCDPENPAAVRRLYELKGRPPERPAAVMFFALDHALAALPELAPRERRALTALLPGPLTVVLTNRRHRFPLACGSGSAVLETPEGASRDVESVGLRVPLLAAGIAALGAVTHPLLQSSANISGAGEARRLADVDPRLRDGADLVLDGGELPGLASTVLDLRGYEQDGTWQILREGPVDRAALKLALGSC